MPVYEYTCPDCDHQFEELVSAAARRKKVACPQCGGRKATRMLSVFAAPQSEAGSPADIGGMCDRCGDPSGPCGMGG